MVFLLGKVRNCRVPCRFCGGDDHDGHLFWDCPFPPLVEIRENPEFHELMEMDKSFWPRCLLWHGWLPLLSGVNRGSPWALSLGEGAGNLLEVALGSYSSAFLLHWHLPDGFDAESASHNVAREPDVWTDGSMVEVRFLVLLLLELGFLPVVQVVYGLSALGVMLMMDCVEVRLSLLVVGIVCAWSFKIRSKG